MDQPQGAAHPFSKPFCWVAEAGSSIASGAKAVGSATNAALPVVHTVANAVALGASVCAVATAATIVGGVTCGGIALAAGGVTAATGAVLFVEGRESGTELVLDVGGFGLSGVGSLAEAGAAATKGFGVAAEGLSALDRAMAELWGATSNGLSLLSRALAAEGFALGAYGMACDP